MTMDPIQARKTIVEGEFLILQAMCQGARDRKVWDDAVHALAGYRFRDPLHQLIFDTLREMNTDVPVIIRELLPQRLTNKGFPDVDIDPFFYPHAMSAELVFSMMDLVKYSERLEQRPEFAPQ